MKNDATGITKFISVFVTNLMNGCLKNQADNVVTNATSVTDKNCIGNYIVINNEKQ